MRTLFLLGAVITLFLTVGTTAFAKPGGPAVDLRAAEQADGKSAQPDSSYPRTTAEQIEYLRALGLINVRIGKHGLRYEINRRNAQKLVSDPKLRQMYLSLQKAMASSEEGSSTAKQKDFE